MFQRKSLCSLVTSVSRDLVRLTNKNAYLRSTASFIANSSAFKSRVFSHMSTSLGKAASSTSTQSSYAATPSSTRSFSSKITEKTSEPSKAQASTSELVIQHGKNGSHTFLCFKAFYLFKIWSHQRNR